MCYLGGHEPRHVSWVNGSTDLNVHLDDGFSNESCPKEGPKRDQEVPTGDSRQVKKRIWDLKGYHTVQKLSPTTIIVKTHKGKDKS